MASIPLPASAAVVEGRVGESRVGRTGLSEAKDLGSSVVSTRFFSGEEPTAKKAISTSFENARV